jgi:hypothetical protein
MASKNLEKAPITPELIEKAMLVQQVRFRHKHRISHSDCSLIILVAFKKFVIVLVRMRPCLEALNPIVKIIVSALACNCFCKF